MPSENSYILMASVDKHHEDTLNKTVSAIQGKYSWWKSSPFHFHVTVGMGVGSKEDKRGDIAKRNQAFANDIKILLLEKNPSFLLNPSSMEITHNGWIVLNYKDQVQGSAGNSFRMLQQAFVNLAKKHGLAPDPCYIPHISVGKVSGSIAVAKQTLENDYKDILEGFMGLPKLNLQDFQLHHNPLGGGASLPLVSTQWVAAEKPAKVAEKLVEAPSLQILESLLGIKQMNEKEYPGFVTVHFTDNGKANDCVNLLFSYGVHSQELKGAPKIVLENNSGDPTLHLTPHEYGRTLEILREFSIF